MPIHKNSKQCQHIKVTGLRCGSPALRGEQFCYFHQRAIRGVRMPFRARLHPAAVLEDATSIQSALMEVVNALIRNTIDLRRAELIIKALHIAAKNVRHAQFDLHEDEMVREVPDYGDVPPQTPSLDVRRPQREASPENPAARNHAENGDTSAIGNANAADYSKQRMRPAQRPPRDEFEVSSTPVPASLPQAKPEGAIDPTRRKPPARAGLPAVPVNGKSVERACQSQEQSGGVRKGS